MRQILKISFVTLIVIHFALNLLAQNTTPSCVVTFPHCNAYFKDGTDINIRVYATDLGGTYTGGKVTNVEFFSGDVKLGESSTAISNTYSMVWKNVPAGNYTITAKATDNANTVFTSAGVIITVGSTASKAMGMSAGKGKYLANLNGFNRSDFSNYWNGVSAENSCKWGSVEATRDVMKWTDADKAYNFAKANNLPFRYHVVAWGSQYPKWIETLSPADFQAEIEEYMAAIAARYPLIDQVDVLNENIYINSWDKKEHAAGTPYFRAGMGGPGITGYDWAIWLFEKARFYFPNAKLVMNDFELETNAPALNEMLAVIKVLRDRGLIDGIGTQAHYFNLDGASANTVQTALNSMAKSGVPIYVTELDMKGSPATEAGQESKYKALFPVFWNHPAVAGITLWGYVEGSTWVAGTGILNKDGSERKAMSWLKSYVASLPDLGYPFQDNMSTSAIGEFENKQNLSIYPNPANSFLHLSTIENVSGYQVFNLLGQPLISKSNPQLSGIDISGLHSGIYLIKIRQNEQEKTYRFVKE